MSRIGKLPVRIPSGVQVHVGNGVVQVKGPKGSLLRPIPDGITITVAGEEITVQRGNDLPAVRALHGLTRALLANAVLGVTTGFRKQLDIQGVGYKAELRGSDELVLSLGFSHPVVFRVPDGVTLTYDAKANRITLEGIDKQKVGQAAAEIRSLRPPDPYKGKGVKYTEEVLKLKAGKSGA
ncbi:MAG: 50S ribosomal protein L6 [Thermoanaerobaculaceae bacterium]|nr:50S ribosomal protein L6 [Thermoanaerobaculaceae bacterium]MDI9622317.1 50S ribosomal protein L6 [Acidobacteriota bacterium]NLH10607.1 50S ribosomal protein L6 [Holophagae bacterium]HPW55071.1 50S ribosomal protein L6 [Thermoanaerobaculaceae bacterium]